MQTNTIFVIISFLAITTEKHMDKVFNPHAIEKKWYKLWETSGDFKANGSNQPSYCIMLPPPNVTGSLHMGHGFQDTLMDALIRFHRMRGFNTLWQPGTDHAGIATQMVVERQLQATGQSRQDLGRDAFVKKIWQWKEESGGKISEQMRRLGSSPDWERERFTLDEDLSHAVQTVFIKLYEEGLIYRGKRLVNWDPILLTAISDLEVEQKEEEGALWHIQYPLSDGSDSIIVATTRPETLLGDVAIAINPNDERYQHLLGKTALLPIANREIPIIADERVEIDFGTGCVKITPAHDFNDYAIGLRHQLPLINIFNPDASLNENVPTAYQGLDRFIARKKIIDELKQMNLLVKTDKHRLTVPRGERSGVIIEPYLTDQWFVKTKPLAEPAISAVEQGKIKFIPENWTKTYYQWMHNIEDWCISRQLWWGHRIPAWYDDNGNVYIGISEQAIRKKHKLGDELTLTQDDDVLDTWFSSALWPFSTLGWPKQTKDLQTYYPTNILVTGFDIIFFWVARMIMIGLKFMGEVPFHEVYITGLIRDPEGDKMSKSKGNVIDPIDLIDGISLPNLIKKRTYGLMQPKQKENIEKLTKKQFPDGIPTFGTDAVRFTYCALATPGRNIRFDLGRLEGYRNFCNKLWNAARFVLMNTENNETKVTRSTYQLNLADQWIYSRLQKTIKAIYQHIENYRFDLLANALYEFTWNEYCDWYLELSKPTLIGNINEEQKLGTRNTLVTVLETLLRLIHPIMPFITEEIWQQVAPLAGIPGRTISLQAYPEFNEAVINDSVETEIEWLKQVTIGIRNIRGEMNISPAKQINVLFHKGSPVDKQYWQNNKLYLQTLAKLSSLEWLAEDASTPISTTTLVGDMEILIPMAGLIDKEAELKRLEKELMKINKELTGLGSRLGNPNFTERAPKNVVAKERARQAELENSSSIVKQRLEKINLL